MEYTILTLHQDGGRKKASYRPTLKAAFKLAKWYSSYGHKSYIITQVGNRYIVDMRTSCKVHTHCNPI